MPKLLVIIASTRPGRAGCPWHLVRAVGAHGAFEVEVADLAEINLPFLDEPNHPSHGGTRKSTRRWSAEAAPADAFVFVMPEYNHGFNAPLKNAIDFSTRSGGASRSGSSPTAAWRPGSARCSSSSRC